MYKDCVETDFSVAFDVDFIKAGDEDKEWRVAGFASVEVPDLEDEILVVKGMDVSYMETHGIINWNHGKLPQFVIGEVDKVEKHLDSSPAKLYVEGVLYKDLDTAKSTYQLMKSLENSSGRKMKMSLEGKAIARDKKKVVKSRITNVALTMQPINTLTTALLKGMCIHPEAESCLHCGRCLTKADTDTLKPIIQESLDKDIKYLVKQGGDKKKDKSKGITKSELVDFVVSKGYSRSFADIYVSLILKQGGIS